MDRDVSYYLEWLADFRKRIEDEREVRSREALDSSSLRGHPLPEWLVKVSTWEGMGVLQFKATYPDWEQRYRASQARYYYAPDGSRIDADETNQYPPDNVSRH